MEEECLPLIVRLLEKIMEPTVILDDSQITTIVKCLTGVPADVVPPKILNDVLTTWLLKAVSQWETICNPNSTVLSLAINLCVYLSSNEVIFIELNNQDVFKRFIRIVKRTLEKMHAMPNVGYVTLISNFLNHKSGCQWIMSSAYWSDIIILTLNSSNSDLTRQGCTFISKLIVQTLPINPEFCRKIIQLIIMPVVNLAASLNDTEILQDLTCVLHHIDPNLNLLIVVLENLAEERVLHVYRLVLEVAEDVQVEKYLRDLKHKISNKYVCFPMSTVLYILGIYEVVVKKEEYPSKHINYEDIAVIVTRISTLKKVMTTNEPISLFVKLCAYGQKLCEKLGPLVPVIITKDNMKSSFSEQLLFYQLYPCIYVGIKLLGIENVYYNIEDVVREHFVSKACKIILPITFRFIFMIRNNLNVSFSLTDATIALEYILETRQYFTREEKNITLHILLHTYEDIGTAMESEPDKIVSLEGKEAFILNLMRTIETIIKESDVNWQDILETMCLMQMTQTVMTFQIWESNIYVCGLKLISLAFQKHFSMNMALLTEQYNDDFLENTVAFISEKLQDVNNEVKCSAIEVIKSVSENVNENFFSFTKMLIEDNIPCLILQMALTGDKCVRSSSFKCLQEMVKIEELWSLLHNSDIIDKVTHVLYSEIEATVRTEATNLITNIYEHQKVPPQNLFRLYDAMSYAVMYDSDQEVKINALEFWKKTTERSLTLQGMLDGEFPKITFSKEYKKIVKLTEVAITNSLLKVLEELSKNGCLAVLVSALEDNEQVQKAVGNIMKNFIQQLIKYGIAKKDCTNLRTDKINLGRSFVEIRSISYKILGREILPVEKFLEVLNNYLFKEQTPNVITIKFSKHLEILLSEIISNNSMIND